MLHRFIFFLIILFVSVMPASEELQPPTPQQSSALEQQHTNTHRIGIYSLGKKFAKEEEGHCSATVVGPHAILTAQHCFKNSNKIRLDEEKETTRIISAMLDGNDHVIYIVDRTFTTWSPISQRNLVVNESVHFWGAPGKNSEVYRDGYFQKITTLKDIDPDEKFKFQQFILPVFEGDSGSGIFDQNNLIVAVVSLGDSSAEELSLPLSFTPAQLAQIK